MGILKFVAPVLLLVVFTIAIISYTTNYAVDNSANINLVDDPLFVNLNTSLQSEMVTFRTDINDSSSASTKSTVEAGSDTLKSPSVFQNIGSSVRALNSVLELIRVKVFGGNPAFYIVISTLTTFFVLVIILYAWKALKQGEVD